MNVVIILILQHICPAQSVRTLKVSGNVEQQSNKNTNKQKDKQGKGAIGKSVKQKVIKGKKILTTIKWASLLSIPDLIKIGQFDIICTGRADCNCGLTKQFQCNFIHFGLIKYNNV